MYSFAQRSDTLVIDEPFYGYYLKHISKIEHPGHQEIIDSMPTAFDQVIADVNSLGKENEIVFLKNMAHHLSLEELDRIPRCRNVLFIRDPKEIIRSFSKVIEQPTMKDIGIRIHLEMLEHLTSLKSNPLVLDALELLKDPKNTLRTLCKELQIPFDISMLSWSAQARQEDGVWAKYWYKNVHMSTGFKLYEEQDFSLPPYLQDLYNEALPYYLELRKYALNATEIR